MLKWLALIGFVAGGFGAAAALSTVFMINNGKEGHYTSIRYFPKPLFDHFQRVFREDHGDPVDTTGELPAPPPQIARLEQPPAWSDEDHLEQQIELLSDELSEVRQLERRGLQHTSQATQMERELARLQGQLGALRGDQDAVDAAKRSVSAIEQESAKRQMQLRERGLTANSGDMVIALSDEPAGLPTEEINTQIKSEVLSKPTITPDNAKVNRPTEASAQVTQEGRDRFESFESSPVKLVAEQPVSTFSVDVDTTSYSFLRSSLNAGRIPSKDAIRIEELINYFPYNYAAPENTETPFRANVVITPTPWNAHTKLMHIGIQGYTPPATKRPRANLVFLIDTSGSMAQPNKLPLLVNSFRLLVRTLDEDDTISIVAYSGSAGVILEPTKASERTKIEAALASLRAGGSTAGASGLKLAYHKARETYDAKAVNRVILATDGDFNVGFSSPEAMKDFVEQERESGVFLSVLGFGRGNYHDALMQALAQNGNGVAAYIDTLSEARKVLADEAGGALIPIAKDVKIQVEFNPDMISEYRLIGYETRALKREDFNNDAVDAGDIGSGHTVTAIYELTPKGSPAELVDPLRYSADASAPVIPTGPGEEVAFIKIRYKQPDAKQSILITRPVGSRDERANISEAPVDTRFATAVAAFGQRLRREGRLGDYDFEDVIALAAASKGDDPFGYRSEFVNLVRLAQSIAARK